MNFDLCYALSAQGLCVVLENRLSHAIMKDLLPLLHPLLHDNSEKVRLAFLELLVLVKGMKSLKFWHICSIDDLLGKVWQVSQGCYYPLPLTQAEQLISG